jgi:hypothetical protein
MQSKRETEVQTWQSLNSLFATCKPAPRNDAYLSYHKQTNGMIWNNKKLVQEKLAAANREFWEVKGG